MMRKETASWLIYAIGMALAHCFSIAAVVLCETTENGFWGFLIIGTPLIAAATLFVEWEVMA